MRLFKSPSQQQQSMAPSTLCRPVSLLSTQDQRAMNPLFQQAFPLNSPWKAVGPSLGSSHLCLRPRPCPSRTSELKGTCVPSLFIQSPFLLPQSGVCCYERQTAVVRFFDRRLNPRQTTLSVAIFPTDFSIPPALVSFPNFKLGKDYLTDRLAGWMYLHFKSSFVLWSLLLSLPPHDASRNPPPSKS